MATTVQVVGNGQIIGTQVIDNITFYGWSYNVVVDGQAGIFVEWIDVNDPNYEPQIIQDVIDTLTADPWAEQGVATNDPGTGDGRGDGQPGEDGDDDDGGDSPVADGGTNPGDGDSV